MAVFTTRGIPFIEGPEEIGGGALRVKMGFYVDISWESRCNIEINVWAHFYGEGNHPLTPDVGRKRIKPCYIFLNTFYFFLPPQIFRLSYGPFIGALFNALWSNIQLLLWFLAHIWGSLDFKEMDGSLT